MPSNHPVVSLIISDKHKWLIHAGVKTTLSELKERFWIIKYRQQVKNSWYACLTCRKLTSPSFQELAAPLPVNRLKKAQAFNVTGVDFAVPLYRRKGQLIKNPTKIGYKKTVITSYISATCVCLFTCEIHQFTRAIHLELVPDLSARSFLLAFRRFAARRGPVSAMYSDNAQTFRCVERHLALLQSDSNIHDLLAWRKLLWIYSASLDPWWGGFWERMVRSVKDLLRRT